jgi:isocitrate lyase
METDKPNYEIAKRFSDLVKLNHPDKMLVYNLSPSFNWSVSGLSDT